MAAMHQRKSRLTSRQQSELIKLFVAGATARAAAELVGVQANTAIRFFTAVIPDARTQTLLPIIRERVLPDSIVYTDTFKAYNALDVSGFRHRRINHSRLFADHQNHINGIENFWNQAKRHLRRFNGIRKENFYWFLKECEWRFNGGNHQAPLKQLKYWYESSKH